MPSSVLVTGVSRYLGAAFAQRLAAADGVRRVIGLDAVEPRHPLGKADFVRSDLRNPLIGRILAQGGVDAVVHLSVSADHVRGTMARMSQKESNVIGTMRLLAACQGRSSVRRIVFKSTGSVYGSSPVDPAQFTEQAEPREGGHPSAVRDALEAEGYVRGVGRRRPDVSTCVLRMAHVVGRDVASPLIDYLRAPMLPVPFGFDPRLQFLHPDDAVSALLAATLGTVSGTVNVAAEGVVTLRQAARVMRRPALPVPTTRGRLLGVIGRGTGTLDLTGEQLDFLLWGRVLDTTRMRADLGVEPRWSTLEALCDLAGKPVPEAHRAAGPAAGSRPETGPGDGPTVAGPVPREATA